MIPGVGGQIKEDMLPDDKHLGKIEAIIYSMTKEERGNPDLMNPSRKKRIDSLFIHKRRKTCR